MHARHLFIALLLMCLPACGDRGEDPERNASRSDAPETAAAPEGDQGGNELRADDWAKVRAMLARGLDGTRAYCRVLWPRLRHVWTTWAKPWKGQQRFAGAYKAAGVDSPSPDHLAALIRDPKEEDEVRAGALLLGTLLEGPALGRVVPHALTVLGRGQSASVGPVSEARHGASWFVETLMLEEGGRQALLRGLEHPDARVQSGGLVALRRMLFYEVGLDRSKVLDTLVEPLLASEDTRVRLEAASVLAAERWSGKASLRILAQALQEEVPDAATRSWRESAVEDDRLLEGLDRQLAAEPAGTLLRTVRDLVVKHQAQR